MSGARIALVVMGVSGSGKSTVAAGIAEALGLAFVDGDGLHSPESVALMQAGTPLTDAERWPWLGRIAARLADAERDPPGLVVACSALRRAYRDRIRAGAPGVRFVFLDGPAELIRARMSGRRGHYMPESLLAGVTENRLGGGIPLRHPKLQVPLDDGHRRLIEMQFQLLVGRAQCGLPRR